MSNEKDNKGNENNHVKSWQYYVKYTLMLCGYTLVIWPLFGLMGAQLSGSAFVYDPVNYILGPIGFSVLLGMYNYHVDSNRKD